MTHYFTIWIDLPVSQPEFANALLGCLRCFARVDENTRLRVFWHGRATDETGELEIDMGMPEKQAKNLLETIDPVKGWLDTGIDLCLPASVDSQNRPICGHLERFGSDHTWNEDAQERAWRSVPLHLRERVHPTEINFYLGQVGGWYAFDSPRIKNIIENLCADIIHTVKPVRFIEGPDLETWQDEGAAFSFYYRDLRELAKTYKLIYGFRTSVDDLARVFHSDAFRQSLPLWRKAPGPDGRIPDEGLFLRRWWHPESPEKNYDLFDPPERSTPDGSPSEWDLFLRACEALGVDTTQEKALRFQEAAILGDNGPPSAAGSR